MQSAAIGAIDRESVHRICSGQVVLTLAVAVKELVENSLDAGATCIDVRIKEYGCDTIEVVDNGSGVEEKNFEGLTLKHHTSKIAAFEDVEAVQTFGFRGEALSSLCAMSKLVITTRHASALVGTRLEFDYHGAIVSRTSCPRPVGTTVCVQQLFHTLPVRHKEFLRNGKKELARMLNLLTAYALISTSVRFTCTSQSASGKKAVVLSTNGNAELRKNIADVFGVKQLECVACFEASSPTPEICEEFGLRTGVPEQLPFRISGYVSSCALSDGRSTTDRQYYYVNGRPCELTKVARIVNETYRLFNAQQYPCVILNVAFDTGAVDVNVTPDKRLIFMEHERLLLAVVKTSLLKMYGTQSADVLAGREDHLQIVLPSSDNGVESKSSIRGQPVKRVLQALYEKLDKSEAKPKQRSLDGFIRACVPGAVTGGATRTQPLQISATADEALPRGSQLSCCRARSSPPALPSLDGCSSPLSTACVMPSDESCHMSPDDGASVSKLSRVECITSHGDGSTQDLHTISTSTSSHIAMVATPTSAVASGECRSYSSCCEAESLSADVESALPLRSSSSSSSILANLQSCLHLETAAAAAAIDSSCAMQLDTDVTMCDDGRSSSQGSRDLAESPRVLFTSDEIIEIDVPRPATHLVRRTERVVNFSMQVLRAACVSASERHHDSASKGFALKFKAKIVPAENDRAEEELRAALGKDTFKEMAVVGQFNLGFIVTCVQRDLFIVDQHASDEKYNFEMLNKTTVMKRQKLVQPMPLHLTAANEIVLMDNLGVFSQNGFDFAVDDTAVPTARVKLTAQPVSKNWSFGKDDIDEMLFMLGESPGTHCRPTRVRAMFASRACRKSVMIGTALKEAEMVRLIRQMAELDHPWNCPHGRPTIRHIINLDLLTSDEG